MDLVQPQPTVEHLGNAYSLDDVANVEAVDVVTNETEPLRGRGLRFVLMDELMRRGSMSVLDLATVVEGAGYRLSGRASKVISDALRWEVRRGRVSRLGRGLYRFKRALASTARRIRLFADRCHGWLVAMTRTGNPPPVPPNRRPGPQSHRARPGQPPWAHLGWLWTM